MAVPVLNGKQQFFDASGLSLALGTVTFYVPGTTTPKDTWQDAAKTTLNSNPITLDANGYAIIFGSGAYRQIVKDALGNTIWDQVAWANDPQDILTTLAASPGSSLVGFTQSGGGSARTVQDKLREVVSAADFPTITAALTEAVNRNLPLLVNANRSLTGNTMTTATLIAGGGIITTGTYTLTVKRIVGDEIALFDKAGTGAITISDNTPSLLGWFAPTADGSTDDTNAVKRWVESSQHRRTGIIGSIATDPVNVPSLNLVATSLTCAGMGSTIFVSRAGDDVFRFPGALVSGIYYVNRVTCGGFTVQGQGSGVGSGYGVVIPSTVGTGRYCYFHDIDATQMGGGCFKDAAGGGGLFSTIWFNCNGGECGSHVFDMAGGGPNSVMELCYPRNAKTGKAGFRLHNSNLTLRYCNGLDANTENLSFWAICGESTSDVTINATTNGAVTIPAGAQNIAGHTRFENCNFEAFPDVCILSIGGPPRLDEKCVFQSKGDAGTKIAVYQPSNIGATLQGVLPPLNQITLTGSATWAQGCPVWAPDTGATFLIPEGDETHSSLNVRSIADSATINYAAQRAKYIANLRVAQALSHLFVDGVARLDGLRSSSSYANDAAAAAAGVGLGELYRNGSVVQIRVT
jgi:hypothetical protein